MVKAKFNLATAGVNLLAVEVDLEVANLDSVTVKLVLVLAKFDLVKKELVLEEATVPVSTRLCFADFAGFMCSTKSTER